MMTDSDALFWLRIVAVASVLQLTILCVATVAFAVMIRRAQSRLDDWHRQHVAPVIARAHEAIDAVHEAARRFRAIDDDVRHTLERVGLRWHHAGKRIRTPIAGVVRGARAAVAALAFGRRARPASPADRDDLERFTNEGGAQHARQ
jgi:hypothetical protein